jgi:hypothetical protein
MERLGVVPSEGSLRAPFFRRVDSVASAFDRSRVLQMVARRKDASDETIVGVLRAAQGLTAHFEAALVLLAVAETHTLSGRARDAYMDAAGKLGAFEQGRVLDALVRKERRN